MCILGTTLFPTQHIPLFHVTSQQGCVVLMLYDAKTNVSQATDNSAFSFVAEVCTNTARCIFKKVHVVNITHTFLKPYLLRFDFPWVIPTKSAHFQQQVTHLCTIFAGATFFINCSTFGEIVQLSSFKVQSFCKVCSPFNQLISREYYQGQLYYSGQK